MEVFQHCQQEAFSSSCCFSKDLIVENELNEYSMAEVLQKLFADVHSTTTSTPITARMSDMSALNDSGFNDLNDSFSSDIAVSKMSSLYINDSNMALVEDEYFEEDELFYPKMCLLSELEDSFDEECMTGGLENPILSAITDCCELEEESSACEVNLSMPVATCDVLQPSQREVRERTSSTRRFRSPAPAVVRYSRHRLSLDSYMESQSKDFDSSRLPSESVLSLVSTDQSINSNVHFLSEGDCCNRVEKLVRLTLAEFAPPCLNHLIGRKIGLDAVDIVGELYDRSMQVVIGKILNYVRPSDLCRICMVSRRWRTAADSNRLSVSRKESFIVSQRSLSYNPQEQNSGERSKCHQKSSAVRLSSLTAEPLAEIRASQCHIDLTVSEQPPGKAQRFWQEAMKLRQDEHLTKCPRCSGPSRTDSVQERATCAELTCRYDFCTRCMSSFHGSLSCTSAVPRLRRSEPCIGSRQSHRNLRRL